MLHKGLKNAFVDSGKGIGRTFVNKFPALRINYFFHSPVFGFCNFKNGRLPPFRPSAGLNEAGEKIKFVFSLKDFNFNTLKSILNTKTGYEMNTS